MLLKILWKGRSFFMALTLAGFAGTAHGGSYQSFALAGAVAIDVARGAFSTPKPECAALKTEQALESIDETSSQTNGDKGPATTCQEDCLSSSQTNGDKGDFAGGNGSPESPYIICHVSHLKNISQNLTAHYVLGQNIDASSTHPDSTSPFNPFTPIKGPFSGSLNGNHFVIRGLYIEKSPEEEAGGLFETISQGARISALGLENLTVYAHDPRGTVVGGLAGQIHVNSPGKVEIHDVYISGDSEIFAEGGEFVKAGGLFGVIVKNNEIGHSLTIQNSRLSGNTRVSAKNALSIKVGGFFSESEERAGRADNDPVLEIVISDSYVGGGTTISAEDAHIIRAGGFFGAIDGFYEIVVNKGWIGRQTKLSAKSAQFIQVDNLF